jgi:hypothetical protein
MSTHNPPTDLTREQELQQIREALRGLRYGAVHIVVQDGLVIQIDRTEKRRLRTSSTATKAENENC